MLSDNIDRATQKGFKVCLQTDYQEKLRGHFYIDIYIAAIVVLVSCLLLFSFLISFLKRLLPLQGARLIALIPRVLPWEGTEKVSIFKDQNGKCLRFITSPSTDRLSKAMLDRKRRVKLRFLRH